MNNHGPILIFEDDQDNKKLYIEMLEELGYDNKPLFFEDGIQALKYLKEDHVEAFLIICDIKMPKMDGLKLRKIIYDDEELREKCIPFIFFSTVPTQQNIRTAYLEGVQGFFKKEDSYDESKATLKKIIEYWKTCLSPE